MMVLMVDVEFAMGRLMKDGCDDDGFWKMFVKRMVVGGIENSEMVVEGKEMMVVDGWIRQSGSVEGSWRNWWSRARGGMACCWRLGGSTFL